MTKADIIKDNYQEAFPKSKIKADLALYLKDFGDFIDGTVNVEVYNIDTTIIKKVTITGKDTITINSYKSIFIFDTDFYFELEVAIGEFEKNDENYSLFKVEKCIAKLKYNEDLSLYDVDFYITGLNTK